MTNPTTTDASSSTINYFAKRGWDVRACGANGIVFVRQTDAIEMLTTNPNGVIYGEHTFQISDYGTATFEAAAKAAREFIR
jgi:hypothetical protein